MRISGSRTYNQNRAGAPGTSKVRPQLPSGAGADSFEATCRFKTGHCEKDNLKGRCAPPVHMIKLTETREITPCVWVHPGEERLDLRLQAKTDFADLEETRIRSHHRDQ
jgi:hypothetical protein